MADPNDFGEKLSAAGIRLRRGETAQAALTLKENSAGEGPGNQSCLVLTDQRLFHISSPGAEAQIKSTQLLDIGDATLATRDRYPAFLIAACFFLVIGVAYLTATAVAGSFQGIVLVPTLLFGGGFLAMWWYSGGDPVIRVKLGDAQFESVIAKGHRQEGLTFLERLTEIKGNGA